MDIISFHFNRFVLQRFGILFLEFGDASTENDTIALGVSNHIDKWMLGIKLWFEWHRHAFDNESLKIKLVFSFYSKSISAII